MKESVQFNEEDISNLKLENRLQQDVCELQKQRLYMETYSRRENVKFVGYSVEEHVDNMNDGEENHNCAQSQIEVTGEIAVYKFLKKHYSRLQMREKE